MAQNESLLLNRLRLIQFDELTSTNLEALGRAQQGEAGDLWIMARSQTGGRGRSGRVWVSQEGNLFASFLTRISAPPQSIASVSLVAGIALFDAVEALGDEAKTAFPLALKWPNDLLCYGQKLAGILVESSASMDQENHPVVIGFGLNLCAAPTGIDQGATSLGEHGLEVAPYQALEILASHLDHWLDIWQEGRNIEAIRLAWLERGVPFGTRLRVHGISGAPREGRFSGLDASGALLLDTGGEIVNVSFGNVDILDGEDALSGKDMNNGKVENGET